MERKCNGGQGVDHMQDERNGRVLQFGAFELKTGTGEIRKHGTRIRLQGRPLHLLQALVERPGGVVTREELRDRLWAADTFVDFESGLNTAVNRLRLALGDSADRPRYVETLARSGYRFMAPVSESYPPPVEENDVPAAPLLPPANEVPRRSSRGWRLAAATAGLAVFAGLLLVVRQKPAPQPTFHQVTFRRTTISCARFRDRKAAGCGYRRPGGFRRAVARGPSKACPAAHVSPGHLSANDDLLCALRTGWPDRDLRSPGIARRPRVVSGEH